MIKIAPYIKIYTDDGTELHEQVERFMYKYSEEEDDVCEIELKSSNTLLADTPSLQEGKNITIEWGYLDTGENTKRKIYIFDTKCEYGDDGIVLTIIGHEKFAIAKIDTATPQKAEDAEVNKIILTADVLKKLNITDEQNNSVYKLLTASEQGKNNKLAPKDKNLKNAEGLRDPGTTVKNQIDNRGNNTPLGDYKKVNPLNPKVTREDGNMTFTIYNGNSATYRTLRDFFNKQPGGPYVIDSRDDSVIIRTRDFTKKPTRTFEYKGEPGTLLSFIPETRNRSKSKAATQINVTSWNIGTKTAVTQSTSGPSNTPKPIWEGFGLSTVNWIKQQQEIIANNQAIEARTGVRLVGKEAQAVGIKSWEQGTKDDHITDKGTDRLKRYDVGDGRVIYTESTNAIGSPLQNSRGYAQRDNTAMVLPSYVRYAQNVKETEGPSKTVVRGAESPNTAKAFADNRQANEALESTPATARLEGDPSLESGQIIEITNVASKHKGAYYIKEVTHTIDSSGYITDIGSMVRPVKARKANTPGVPTKDGLPVKTAEGDMKKPLINPKWPRVETTIQNTLYPEGITKTVKTNTPENT